MPTDRLIGDAEGIEELKAIVKEHRDFIRFLIEEAKSNTDHEAPFTGKSGAKYILKANLATGKLEVRKAG